MRAPTRCLLGLLVLASACKSGLHTPRAEAGIVDSGTSRETAPAGPEVASDGIVDRPSADRELPDLQPVPDTASAGPEVAHDAVVDRVAADRPQPPDLSLGPDMPADAPDPRWTEQQACENSTRPPTCDLFPPAVTVSSAPNGPLLAEVQVTSGSCYAPQPCPLPLGCTSMQVTSNTVSGLGTCDLLAIATDRRREAFQVTKAWHGPFSQCCAGPSGKGSWVTYSNQGFDRTWVVVDFSLDGGVPDGGDAADSSASDSEKSDAD